MNNYYNQKKYYESAKRIHNSLYLPYRHIDLIRNINERTFPDDIRNTDNMSGNFSHMKIYREELDEINTLRSPNNNPAFDFLMLLSYAVCGNVDTYKVCDFLSFSNCYLSITDLFKIFHTHSVIEINKKLNNLKYGYHVLNYEIKPVKNHFKRYYIQFNVCNDQIIEGPYDDKNLNYFDIKGCAFAAKQRKGFFFINKYWFSKVFFPSIDTVSHGVKDLYCLLRINTCYKDNEIQNHLSENHHIVAWGKMNNQYCNKSYLVNTIKNISTILNNKKYNIKRYLNKLQEKGFIKKFYIRKKGLAIINSYLDKKHNTTVYNRDFLSNLKTFSYISNKYTNFNEKPLKFNINEGGEMIKKVVSQIKIHTANFYFLFKDKHYPCKI